MENPAQRGVLDWGEEKACLSGVFDLVEDQGEVVDGTAVMETDGTAVEE